MRHTCAFRVWVIRNLPTAVPISHPPNRARTCLLSHHRYFSEYLSPPLRSAALWLCRLRPGKLISGPLFDDSDPCTCVPGLRPLWEFCFCGVWNALPFAYLVPTIPLPVVLSLQIYQTMLLRQTNGHHRVLNVSQNWKYFFFLLIFLHE